MQTLRTHVAGIDVHKKMLAITVLCGNVEDEPSEAQFECGTFTEDLIVAGQKLLDMGVKEAVLESTGIYWKPVYNVWKPMGINLTLAQAAHVKNVPGRKTDMNDSQWLARLHRHGLIRNSFIPEKEFQNLRMIVRHRCNLVSDLSRVKNRVQKILEDGNVKWSSIVSDAFGVSGLNILSLIASGVTDATALSSGVVTNISNKDQAEKALRNCLTREHVFMISELMSQYKDLQKRIAKVNAKLETLTAPYRHLIDKLKEIPGIEEIIAIGILAESSDDMTNFENARHYAAWSGTAAGNNESAGKKKDRNAGKGIPI